MTDFKGIEAITEMFSLRDIPASNDGKIIGGFAGFVVPPNYITSYNRPALSVNGHVTIASDGDMFTFYGCVSSIDDAGISFFGPSETKEKSEKRLKMFREMIEVYHPFMPSVFELEEWGQRAGVTIDRW